MEEPGFIQTSGDPDSEQSRPDETDRAGTGVLSGRFPYSGNHLTKEDEEMVSRAISYMELEELEHRFLDELSGGQRQRAYIAMVIAQDTEYILLDEPTNNLDIYHAGESDEDCSPPL